jgi:epoxyqueuosine reductase
MTRDERERLRAALAAPGFDDVRFALVPRAVPGGEFRAWLDAGHHADMDWLPRTADKRLDPDRVLPGVRTVIVLGVNYLPRGRAARGQQRWAKYALWSDYHDTIVRGLYAAGAVLEAQCGLRREDYRVYVDAGPVLERGWAAVAGVGWQGKNGMLISRREGNWLFLAAILARCEIPPDAELGGSPRVEREPPAPPLGRHCGSCTRCLVACPTKAFPRPGWVDARRCIAYHTIENRGLIPRELRAQFGGRVFGCDVCLDVCPWNRFAQAARSALLTAREELADLTLLDLLAMDDARFRAIFRQSPIKRVKLAGLLRNACVAAGNWHATDEWHFGGGEDHTAVVVAVERLCAHASPVVRAHAVWALQRLVGAEEATRRLATVQAEERDDVVRAEYAAPCSR